MKSQNCCLATFRIKSVHDELMIARGQSKPVPSEREIQNKAGEK